MNQGNASNTAALDAAGEVRVLRLARRCTILPTDPADNAIFLVDRKAFPQRDDGRDER